MEATQRIPVLLVSGFLGSGKTTLINRFLRTHTGLRLGVVVNEFGQIGIDGALLHTTDILELSEGCVCCASGNELWEAAQSLIDRAKVTHLLVETSGIAEPGVLREQYKELPEALAGCFDLCGLLCLVDVLHVHEAVRRRSEARHQLEQADRLLLTKLDLCQADELPMAHRLLDEMGATAARASLHPLAPDHEIRETLRWAFARTEQGAGRTQHAHVHERQLCAISWKDDVSLWEAPLLQLLHDLPGQVLRAKGLVRLLDSAGRERLAVVQLAGRRVELEAASLEQERAAPSGSTLVFIGEGLDEEWLRIRLSACRAQR